MKNIRFEKGNIKNITIFIEEAANYFFSSLYEDEVKPRVLAIQNLKDVIVVQCYRCMNEEIKIAIYEYINRGKQKKGYYFSSELSFDKKAGKNCIIVLHYETRGEKRLVDKYIEYQIKKFFDNIVDILSANTDDKMLYLKNQAYESSRAFVEMQIEPKVICMSRIPYFTTVLAIEGISQLSYESEELERKTMVITSNRQEQYEILLDNKKSKIRLTEKKKVRKLLQIAGKTDKGNLCLLCDGVHILGFILLENISGEYFVVEFERKGVWKFGKGNDEDGIKFRGNRVEVSRAKSDGRKERFLEQYMKIFGQTDSVEKIWEIVEMAKKQRHGTMLVFLDNAEVEKNRLYNASFAVENGNAICEYMEQITAVDGAILLDRYGKIYSIGVILDGQMTDETKYDMSRGARYNSAIKYSVSCGTDKNLIVVFSEDGDINLISNGQMLQSM